MASQSPVRMASVPGPGQQIGQLAIRTGIAAGGLFVLRLIVDMLPLGTPIYPVHSPALTANTTAALGQLAQQFAAALSPGLAAQQQQTLFQALQAAHAAIFPVTVAMAVIDTLILVVLFRFGVQLGSILGASYARLPAIGTAVRHAVTAAVAGLGYNCYQGIGLPLLGPEHQSFYGWVWLVIVAVPVIALAAVVAQNLDAISAVAFHGARAAAGGLRCPGCGFQLEAGARFCPNCGADGVPPVIGAAPRQRACGGCGAQLGPTARFCKSCGQPAPAA